MRPLNGRREGGFRTAALAERRRSLQRKGEADQERDRPGPKSS